MAVIDSDNFITHLVYGGIIDNATCGELREAIEQCTVKDIYTKADVITILTELQKEINEEKRNTENLHYDDAENAESYNVGIDNSIDTIQERIDKLKEE